MGPLDGLRVIELVGLGPGAFAGMLLADLGADVLCVDRLGGPPTAGAVPAAGGVLHRGKRTTGLDLKHADGPEVFLRLVEQADAVIEVFRPGVAERIGIGPDACLARNPQVVYGRLTGWGQEGPWAHKAGHDIDYIAMAGALEPLGRAGQPPTPPINVLGDFAGGGMLLAFGIVAAAWEATTSGAGQVVDAAMIDGSAILMAPFFSGRAKGGWGPRGTNVIDTGAPFYDVYETADAKWIAVGAIEPQFYAALLAGLGRADDDDLAHQWDREHWPRHKVAFAAAFKSRTRDEWEEIFDGTDACVAPVLDPVEATAHPMHQSRRTFLERDGTLEPAPAPRFSRTRADAIRTHTDTEVLAEWGLRAEEIATLRAQGVIR